MPSRRRRRRYTDETPVEHFSRTRPRSNPNGWMSNRLSYMEYIVGQMEVLNDRLTERVELSRHMGEQLQFERRKNQDMEQTLQAALLELDKLRGAKPSEVAAVVEKSTSNPEPTYTCCICLEEKTLPVSSVFTCGHVVCNDCVGGIRARSRSNKLTCPHCRVKSKVTPIFVTFTSVKT